MVENFFFFLMKIALECISPMIIRTQSERSASVDETPERDTSYAPYLEIVFEGSALVGTHLLLNKNICIMNIS